MASKRKAKDERKLEMKIRGIMQITRVATAILTKYKDRSKYIPAGERKNVK